MNKIINTIRSLGFIALSCSTLCALAYANDEANKDLLLSAQIGEVEGIAAALSGVISNAPDVRVFNLSFDTKQSLEALLEVAPTYLGHVMKAMEDFDIERVQDDYAAAARRCREGDLDGCEFVFTGHHFKHQRNINATL